MAYLRTSRSSLDVDERPTTPARFDYSRIPSGYYDSITREGNPIRRLWHLSKFERVMDYLPEWSGQRLLDIGCFAGTFLGMLDVERFSYQLGVDILPDQIEYARQRHGRSGGSSATCEISATLQPSPVTSIASP